VGHVHIMRAPPPKILVKDRGDEMHETAREDLRQRKWVTRLARPVEHGSEGIISVEVAPELAIPDKPRMNDYRSPLPM
jgi:hypothetical protein